MMKCGVCFFEVIIYLLVQSKVFTPSRLRRTPPTQSVRGELSPYY